MASWVTVPSSLALRLLVLARPLGAALITSLPLVGFGFALWERGSTVSLWVVWRELALLASSWLCLHAGAMWLNADLDRDSGPVLFGRPIEVPRAVVPAGYAALAASVAIASLLGTVTFACSLACALLAVLYSHPKIALKGSAIGGPLVNALGYGALSPIAGFTAGSGIVSWRSLLTLALGILFLLGTYFAAQVFQGDEDRRRGYRTLVVTHGPARTLAIAHACLRVAALGAIGAAIAGVYPRLLLSTLPAWIAVERHLARWRATPSADRAAGLVGRLALCVLATVIAAYADHFWLILSERPGGGCATAIVPEVIAPLCPK